MDEWNVSEWVQSDTEYKWICWVSRKDNPDRTVLAVISGYDCRMQPDAGTIEALKASRIATAKRALKEPYGEA
ncbi:MAG: hypothetical protein ACRCZI_04765 [Cetobacterium sp.]